MDLQAFFDNVRHHVLLAKVAQRINDAEVMQSLKSILKASGSKGVPQGGVISPLLSNLYLTEVDRMLERAKEVTRRGKYTYLEYARFADDLVILVDAYRDHDWLLHAVDTTTPPGIGGPASRPSMRRRVGWSTWPMVTTFSFLGFDFRRVKSRRGVWRPWYTPRQKKRTALLRKLKDIFRRYESQPVDRVSRL